MGEKINLGDLNVTFWGGEGGTIEGGEGGAVEDGEGGESWTGEDEDKWTTENSQSNDDYFESPDSIRQSAQPPGNKIKQPLNYLNKIKNSAKLPYIENTLKKKFTPKESKIIYNKIIKRVKKLRNHCLFLKK